MSDMAEKRSYAKGYAAGRKKQISDEVMAARVAGDLTFWEKAFLSVSEHFISCAAWKRGEESLSSMDARVELAASFATKALTKRRSVR